MQLTNIFDCCTAPELEEYGPQMAILPIGAFEQHGPHLPMETDTLIACSIARQVQKQCKSFILSPITISCSHEHNGFFPSIWISPTTLVSMVKDISESLAFHGVQKLCIVNAHGGNYVLDHFAQMENMVKNKVLLVPRPVLLNQAIHNAGIEHSQKSDMHAGEYETSILLAEYPDVVRRDLIRDHVADDRPLLHLHGLRHYSSCGVVGYPEAASADKGRKVLKELGQVLEPTINEFLLLDTDKRANSLRVAVSLKTGIN